MNSPQDCNTILQKNLVRTSGEVKKSVAHTSPQGGFEGDGVFIKYENDKYVLLPTGKSYNKPNVAVQNLINIYKIRDYAFFSRLGKTIEYLRKKIPKEDLYILGSFLANYNFRKEYIRCKYSQGKALQEWVPKKRMSTIGRKPLQQLGLEQIVFERLIEIGANAHVKTMSKCSRASMWLINNKDSQVASYSIPCRKPTCIHCSNLVDKDSNEPLLRSQNISERAKNHYRYALINGDIEFYGRMIFTFPKKIQELVDRRDLVNAQSYGSAQVYGSALEREIESLIKEREEFKCSSVEGKERETGLERYKKQISRKREKLKEFNESGLKLRSLESKKRKLEKNKPEGWEVKREKLKGKLKLARKRFKKIRSELEKGRILLNDIQRVPYEFLSDILGIKGLLDTPHLTGEKSMLRGDFHLHFHALFPLIGDEYGFDWKKGQPFIPKEKLEEFNQKWKEYLEKRFDMKIEEKISNPQYEYVSVTGSNEEDITKLAFWLRYDHRIEAGGAWFAMFADDKNLSKVLRMTTNQRYTRGYGIWSDRNLKDFENEYGGTKLKDWFIKNDSKEVEVIEGEWKPLSLEKLSEDVPFTANIDSSFYDKFDKQMMKESIKNVPVELYDSENPLFVKYVQYQPANGMEETSFEIRYFHEQYNVCSIWKKRRRRVTIEEDGQKVVRYATVFDLERVEGKLPKEAKEEGNGFYLWDGEVLKIQNEINDNINNFVTKQTLQNVFDFG